MAGDKKTKSSSISSYQPLKAALWMLGAVVSFTSMAIAGREMAGQLDTFEIMLYRSAGGVLILVIVGWLSNSIRKIRAQRMGLHFIRNVSHFAGQNLWFYAIMLLPLAQVFAFEFTTPLWVSLLAPVFLAEKLTSRRVLAACLGFGGILLVAQPGSVALSAGVVAAALCAIGFAGAIIMTKMLARTESTISILFWLSVIQTGLGLLFAGYDGAITLPSFTTWPWVILVACAGLLAHYCITTALSLAPAGIVAPMDFIRLPLIAFLGMLLYDELLDKWMILGAIMVVVANFWNIYGAQKPQAGSKKQIGMLR